MKLTPVEEILALTGLFFSQFKIRRGKMNKNEVSRPIKNIVVSYLIFGIVWILFSDSIAGLVTDDMENYQKYQSLKGLIYIAVTGGFLYFI